METGNRFFSRKPPLKARQQIYGDMMITVATFFSAIICCYIINQLAAESAESSHVPLIFVLAVAFISRVTNGYFWGVATSFLSVFFVNYYFTYPFHAFNFTLSGYPLTFLSMLAVSTIISAATTRIKQQDALRSRAEQELLRANLLRSVSHDIRTPLTSIVGASSVLLESGETLEEEQKQVLLTDIHEDAQWLIRVVENLLSITRISGQAEISKQPELIEEVISETVQKFRKTYPGIRVSAAAPEDILLIPMDAILIEQVLFNLLENAARHGKHTRNISIVTRRQGCFAYVSVEDDGCGIHPERLKDLFSGSYGQITADKPDGKRDMGIGLSVCSAIIQAHGGTLSARNGHNGGAVFTFTLPLEEQDENKRPHSDH